MNLTIEERLLQDPYILSYEPGRRWDFPQVDFSAYDPSAVEFMSESVAHLQAVLSAPYVVDVFTDHDARRAWRGQLDHDVSQHLQSNSLRRGRLSQGILAAQLLASERAGEESSGLQDHADRMNTCFDILETCYDDGSTAGKITFAKAFKHSAYALLEQLTA